MSDDQPKFKKDRTAEYVLSAIVISCAIANFFILRNVRKYHQLNKSNNYQATMNNFSTRANERAHAEWIARQMEEELKARMRFKDYINQQEQFYRTKQSYEQRTHKRGGLPINIANALKLLDLPSRLPSSVDLKKAFRSQALKYHPDRLINEQVSDDKKQEFNLKFRQISDAYSEIKSYLDHKDINS